MTKILLVEDDKSLREIYGVRLLAEGYDIVSAGDGEEALAMAIKERPQLIVSDVMMPKISGFDMLDILRSTSETKDIKVIMMTALSSEDQRLRGQQLGADRYLVKSQVGIEDVVRTVHDVLEDAPVAPAGNTFASAAPSAVPRSDSPVVPPRQDPAPSLPASPAPMPAPQAAATAPAPMSMAPPAQPSAPAPVPAPAADPVAPAPTFSSGAAAAVPPMSPMPAPQQPAPSSLPQPTAPFSTQRPAGLADRIIQPLERPADANEPMENLMAKELGDMQQQPAPQPQPSQPAPAENHGIEFEETPRPSGDSPS
jgi:CheY-like chemotaxis protein